MTTMNMIVVGANSSIAKDCIAASAANLERLALCGRNSQSLSVLEHDLHARFPSLQIKTWPVDLMDTGKAAAAWQEMEAFCGRVDQIVFAPSELGNNAQMEADPELAFRLVALNCAASTAWLLGAANVLERRGGGVLAIITSVAGVRGRASNYIYGSTKAQLATLAQGLRVRLARVGARVVDFRPGMVDTPMTASIKKGLLMASSQYVGHDLALAIATKDGVVYSPRFWGGIMFIIRHLPYFIFKRTKF